MRTEPDLQAAADFVWRHARLLDRRRFEYLFEGGSPGPVVEALNGYRNPDGGFGHALEPDLRDPHSQPVPAEIVVRVLDEIGGLEGSVAALCDWLDTVTTADGGIPFCLASAGAYPRAPWWQPSDEASLNPTAAIAGLLTGSGHPWVARATDYCWKAIETLQGFDPHLMFCVLTFLERAPDRDRAQHAFAELGPRIAAHTELDPNAEGYVHGPLDFAPSPHSIARGLYNDAVVEAHLDALVAKQGGDGGWPITWEPPSDAVRWEWRGSVTIKALQRLRAYGRLP